MPGHTTKKTRANRKATAEMIAKRASTKSKKKPVKKATAKKPTSKKSPAKKISNLTKRGKLGLITGIGTVIAGATALRNKPKSFGEAFKKARKDKGPNSTFTYKGKKYSTVTKDQIKKAGFTNLRDYLNSKKKK
jgi:hypothetical protein